MIGIGIVGYGGFGQFLHRSWLTLPGARVVAVADGDPARRPTAAGVRFYPDLDGLLADPAVELVALVTPPNAHADQSIRAMDAGRHVLIEKPLATNRADAERIIAARDRTGRVAAVDYMLRFHPLVEALAALSKAGTLGKLRRVAVENEAQDETLPAEHWFWDEAVSGGILVEHAVHFIDLVAALGAGPAVRVTGVQHRRDERRTDQVLADVVHEGGLVATHYHAFQRPGFFERTAIRLSYDLGQFDLLGWIPLTGTLTALVDPAAREALARLPGFIIETETPLGALPDGSRPAGWGPTAHDHPGAVVSGGVRYPVTTQLVARFGLSQPKGDVYAACVRAALADVIASIENPTHRLRVPLEVGLSSLDIALRATEAGR